MHQAGKILRLSLASYCYDNGNALHDIEDILVACPVRRPLPLVSVAVKIEHVDAVKHTQHLPAHPSEGRVCEVSVARDKAENAFSVSLDVVGCEPQEFVLILIDPL